MQARGSLLAKLKQKKDKLEKMFQEKPKKRPKFHSVLQKKICYRCLLSEPSYGIDRTLLQCSKCRMCVHTHCHEPTPLSQLPEKYRHGWQCAACKTCACCGNHTADDENDILLCDTCERGFHYFCLKLKGVPDGDHWHCPDCSNTKQTVERVIRVHVSGNAYFQTPESMSGIASVPIEHVVHDNIQNFKLVNQLRKRWNSIDLATRVPDSESEEAHQILFEHPFLTEEEATVSLKLCKNKEDVAIKKLNDPLFLKQVRKTIALDAKNQTMRKPTKRIKLSEDRDYEIQTEKAEKPKVEKPEKPKKKTKTVTKKSSSSDNSDSPNPSWSDARRNAYSKIDTAPNAYYYRFNKPGEAQKNGKWSDEEKALFLKRLKEVGHKSTSPQWGLLAMEIPGRVGYQCSNFYRLLVQRGELKDEFYGQDQKTGKLVWKKQRKRKRSDDDEESEDDDE